MNEDKLLKFALIAWCVLVVILAACLICANIVIDNLQQENLLLRAEIQAAESRNTRTVRIIPQVEMPAPAINAEPMTWPVIEKPWNTIHNCTVTAYCACDRCCGRWADGLTASGATPTEGVTVAVDTSVIPLGAEVRFEGDDTVYIAQDTGVAGSHIDRYFNDHAEAEDFGVQYKTVYWRERT